MIRELFGTLGFARRNEAAPEGTTRWAVDLASYPDRPTFIRRGPPA